MLKLLDCPNRVDPEHDLAGAPHAADCSYTDNRFSDYPTCVRWPAENDNGGRVVVLIGFKSVNSTRISQILKNQRDAIL